MLREACAESDPVTLAHAIYQDVRACRVFAVRRQRLRLLVRNPARCKMPPKGGSVAAGGVNLHATAMRGHDLVNDEQAKADASGGLLTARHGFENPAEDMLRDRQTVVVYADFKTVRFSDRRHRDRQRRVAVGVGVADQIPDDLRDPVGVRELVCGALFDVHELASRQAKPQLLQRAPRAGMHIHWHRVNAKAATDASLREVQQVADQS